ncbi:MAG: hypothetical protein JNM94_15500 [Phycisphaerae bacterium]|nr:hypothetical protein [Phycisphaerae bacterium]
MSNSPTQDPGATKALRDRENLLKKCPAPNAAGFIGDPYPFDDCVVSGEKLGPTSVSLIFENAPSHLNEKRHLRFCCEECKAKFLERPTSYLAALDRRIIDAQKAGYPISHCLVAIDTKLDPTTCVDVVYGNRLYRLSNGVAQGNFVKNLKVYVKAYEGQVAAVQRAKYPLTTCVVTGVELPAKPVDIVVGARLVRLANDDAVKAFYKDPAPALAKLEAAYAARATAPATPSAPKSN